MIEILQNKHEDKTGQLIRVTKVTCPLNTRNTASSFGKEELRETCQVSTSSAKALSTAVMFVTGLFYLLVSDLCK